MSLTNGTDVSANMEDIKTDISVIREDIGKLFSTMGDIAKSKSSDGYEASKAVAGKAKDGAVDAKTYVEDQVRTHPLTTIGIAVGAGAVLAMLRRK